jgi:hypothetical protein
VASHQLFLASLACRRCYDRLLAIGIMRLVVTREPGHMQALRLNGSLHAELRSSS